MKLLRHALTALFCVHIVSVGVARAGDAATILTFDDLSPGPDHAIIQNGYGGLHWNNFSVINGSLRPPTEGYHTGTVSPGNVAFNTSGDPASISSTTRFDLKSAYLTAALNLDSEMQIEVQGFVGTTLIYDNTYTVDRAAPTLINFNYLGVDRVRFVSSPPIQFAMDNLTAVLGPREPLPEVWIAATAPETLEPSPNTRVSPGEFTITRAGDTNEPLILFVEFTGTATFGQDYQEVSQFLIMPAGERKLTVVVGPLDDSAVEGDETVIATLSTNPPINSLPNYRVDPLRNRAMVVIHDNDPPSPPVVSLELVDPEAMETVIFQNNIDWAQFRVLRTGPATEELVVFLNTRQGSARLGEDYRLEGVTDGSTVRFPAGVRSVNVRLYPIDDDFYEGDETVFFHLIAPPFGTPLPDQYDIDFAHSAVAMVIHDNDPVTTRLDITSPRDGQQFQPGDIIELRAQIIGPGSGKSWSIEFFDGDQRIGTTQPGGAIWWSDASGGQHVITARATDSQGTVLTSSPATIRVGPGATLPVVRLETFPLQNPQAREFCPPNLDCAYPSFVVRRSGPTNADLRVYLSYSGTAAAGVDYPSLPDSLVIPAGRDAEFLMLVPKDDTLVEGPETVIARFTPVPGPGYIPDPDQASATITILDNERPLDTVVSIGTDDDVASEISILAVIDPARFRISRTGDLSRELMVFYSVHGSATPGVDYPELNSSIRIPAGESSVTFDITPRFDQLMEGMETVYIRLEPSPLMGPMPTYDIAPTSRDAVAVILDNGSFPTPGLEIVRPEEGDRFAPPASIEIVVAAYHPTRDVSRVDFYAGAAKIGESIVIFDRPSTGGLIVHRFTWNNPSAGVHVLTARGFEENQRHLLTSTPVRITVGPEPSQPEVSIAATQRIAEESSEPFRRMNLIGEFTISRTGPTNQPLHFFVHYSGMATPGVDYPYLPWIVTIPAGAVSTTIQVIPNNDRIPEGIETLVATLSDCPPVTDPPLGVPCVVVGIDPAHESSTVFIRDDGLTEASLVITKPSDGASFPPGETILIEATAIDLEGYISRVEFWDNETRIGVSVLFFFVAPDPGTPIHHSLEWRGAASGEHVLTARAVRPDGMGLRSQSVKILIRDSQPNRPPQVTITRPVNGAGFPPDTAIEIVADTRDPDGYVRKAEFFADGRKIGEQNIEFIQPPEPGQPQTFAFVWRFPTPGSHVLTVRATDDDGATAWSSPVEIRVTVPDQFPIVSVVTRDAFGVEPASNADVNTATFRIRRFGPTNGELPVAYSLQGTAQNGVDYEALTGLVVIPVGQRSVNVIVRPLTDNLSERIETVILRLEGSPGEQPTTYRVGHPRRAVALIGDGPMAHASGRAECLPLPDGLLNVCFTAETGQNFRVEASSDVRNWETVFDTPAIDGALDFVDDEAANFPHRFYRLAPEPVTLTDE